MIQPSLTGLVHALFATQHCVLGYYQAVPAGLYATNRLSQLGGWKGMHLVPNGCGCHPAMIQPSRQSLDKCRNPKDGLKPVPFRRISFSAACEAVPLG